MSANPISLFNRNKSQHNRNEKIKAKDVYIFPGASNKKLSAPHKLKYNKTLSNNAEESTASEYVIYKRNYDMLVPAPYYLDIILERDAN
jgi:hypothetical protein